MYFKELIGNAANCPPMWAYFSNATYTRIPEKNVFLNSVTSTMLSELSEPTPLRCGRVSPESGNKLHIQWCEACDVRYCRYFAHFPNQSCVSIRCTHHHWSKCSVLRLDIVLLVLFRHHLSHPLLAYFLRFGWNLTDQVPKTKQKTTLFIWLILFRY